LLLGGGGDKRKSSATHTKDFCGKNVPKLPDFEENTSEIRHLVIDPLENPVQLIQRILVERNVPTKLPDFKEF
jgi:hypothetical protein